MKYGFTFLIVFFSSQSFSDSWRFNSAERKSSETYEDILYQRDRVNPALRTTGSAHSNAVFLEQLNDSSLVHWKKEEIDSAFLKIRDERFVKDPAKPLFPRRSTWLYPQDGCWARAALSAKRTTDWGLKRPNKIFVFGDLKVKTQNTPSGVAEWWYHTAVVVKDEENNLIVLDPALEPLAPTPLVPWLEKMGNPSKLRIALCHTLTYGPMDSCETPAASIENDALKDQIYYLPKEWDNLVEMKRDPWKELANDPPWDQVRTLLKLVE